MAKSPAATWIEQKAIIEASRATPIVDPLWQMEEAIEKHLQWYFNKKVLIDKNTNRFFKIRNIKLNKDDVRLFYWDKTYEVLFDLYNSYCDDMWIKININLDHAEQLVDKYDQVLNMVNKLVNVRAEENVTEMEEILFM